MYVRIETMELHLNRAITINHALSIISCLNTYTYICISIIVCPTFGLQTTQFSVAVPFQVAVAMKRSRKTATEISRCEINANNVANVAQCE